MFGLVSLSLKLAMLIYNSKNTHNNYVSTFLWLRCTKENNYTISFIEI